MGWTFTHREPGTTDREWVTTNLLDAGMEIVACATKSGVFYAAVKNGPEAKFLPGQTWALVMLIQRTRGYHNFGYKDMDESVGPVYYDAPAAVLNALSPTENDYATKWREQCRANLAATTTQAKVKPGDTVRFTHPLDFGKGRVFTELVFQERSTFRVDRLLLRVPNWRKMHYTIIPATPKTAS